MKKNDRKRVKAIHKNTRILKSLAYGLESLNGDLVLDYKEDFPYYGDLENMIFVINDVVENLEKVIPMKDLEEAGVYDI